MADEQISHGGLSGSHTAGQTHHEHGRTVPPDFVAKREPDRAPKLPDTASWSVPAVDRREQDLPSERRKKSSDSLIALVTTLRWGTTSAGLLWAAALRSGGFDLVIGVALVVHAVYRTFRPVEYRRRGWRSLLSILVELALNVSVIVATGSWESPYIFALFIPVIAAGFARGFWHAFRIGVTGAFAVGLAAILLGDDSGIRPMTAWCGELLLTAVVASYGRRLLSRAEELRAENLSQVWRLNEANGLLVNLNRLAQDLPASFDFHDTVQSALAQVREVTQPDLCAVLTLDPISPFWNVALAEGAMLPDSYSEEQLPSAIRSLAHHRTPQIIGDLSKTSPGLTDGSRSGLYVPLWAGQRQVGLLVIESGNRDHFGMRHARMLNDIAEPMALTIDNARWFDRLRARGAAQERNRIARDLHDRVGQEIAYVAFELDRLCGRVQGTDLEEDLGQLRIDARLIVRELRETLYDLRTDVSEEQGLTDVLSAFLDRVAARSTIRVEFTNLTERRLPLSQEREVWRIAQEAIVNAERHADAGEIRVEWDVDTHGAQLTITDDGVGMQETAPVTGPEAIHGPAATARPSYGLTGMRERAESIGGLLTMSGGSPTGTVVQLKLGSRRETTNNARENTEKRAETQNV